MLNVYYIYTVCISSIPHRQIRFLVLSIFWSNICSVFNPCLLPLIPMVILDSFPSPPNLNYLILVFSELLTGLSLTEICINNFWTAPIQQQCSGMPLPFASHLLTVHSCSLGPGVGCHGHICFHELDSDLCPLCQTGSVLNFSAFDLF